MGLKGFNPSRKSRILGIKRRIKGTGKRLPIIDIGRLIYQSRPSAVPTGTAPLSSTIGSIDIKNVQRISNGIITLQIHLPEY
jgi:hypothetical protein